MARKLIDLLLGTHLTGISERSRCCSSLMLTNEFYNVLITFWDTFFKMDSSAARSNFIDECVASKKETNYPADH